MIEVYEVKMYMCMCAFIRVEGVHAIMVTDREGVPLLQGTLVQVLQSVLSIT